MKIIVGNPKQKASRLLVIFVFACIVISIAILFILQQATEKNLTLNELTQNLGHYPF